MLHLIPAPVHRQILRWGHCARIWWRGTVKSPSGGVSFIGTDAGGRVLLVRHSYGSGKWSLPGGGLGRHEDPADCVRREMREELACELENLELAVQFEESLFGAPHTAYVFLGNFAGEPRIDGREIIEMGWFALDALPPAVVSFAHFRLKRVFPDL